MSRKNSGGRTLAVTVNDLLDSVRFKIAVKAFVNGNHSFMKALLIELGMEAEKVSKNAVIKAHNQYSTLAAFERIPFMKSVGDAGSEYQFNRYNIFWSLSPLEQELYMEDPKMKKSPEEYQEILEKVRIRRMGS